MVKSRTSCFCSIQKDILDEGNKVAGVATSNRPLKRENISNVANNIVNSVMSPLSANERYMVTID